VDLRYDNQIIVNPELQRTVKTAALTPIAAKAAAAAGVKPAALITRLPPHDRTLPKPAFELTEKKLDPKAGAAKKTAAPKAKAKKTAAKGKAATGAKKAAPPARPGKSVAAKKSYAGSAGSKPSAAVAKTQAAQGPSQ
jgi:hypothetical protein